MPNWIKNIPDYALYPFGWYLAATDWIAEHRHWTFWIIVALAVLALVF